MVLLVLRLEGGEGAPQAQAVGVERVVPRDGGVVGHGFHELTLGPPALLNLHTVDLHELLLDLPVELDLVGDIVALDFPRDAFRVTEVGDLDLLAKLLNNVLLEVPVVVPDSIAPCGYLEGSHGVQEASGKPTEASPAEPHVALVLIELFQGVPQVFQRLRVLVHQIQVHQNVLHHSPLQVLRGEVVDALRVVVCVVLVGIVEALNQTVADAARHRHGQVALVKVEAGFDHGVLDVVDDLLLYEPPLMPQVGAHEAPELGINFLLRVVLSWGSLMCLVHFLVLEFRLHNDEFRRKRYLHGMRDAPPSCSCWTCCLGTLS